MAQQLRRQSTVTARERPVSEVTSVTGMLRVHGEMLSWTSTRRLEVQDVTDQVMARVKASGVHEGLAHLSSLHTTCTVFINEFQEALVADITTFVERVVSDLAPDGVWQHDDPAFSDCSRMNAEAHLRALFLGHTLALQVSGGELVLGQWQRILVAELDGPRERTLRLSVMGT